VYGSVRITGFLKPLTRGEFQCSHSNGGAKCRWDR